jgi:hypothetical protein
MKDSFVFYKSWIKAIRRLESPESQMKVINAICDFTFEDTNFNESDFSNIELVALDTILPLIETAKKHYENGLKGKEFGKLGGRPKKEKTPTETPIQSPNDNDNVNFNVNDNFNANDKDNANDTDNVNVNDTEKEKVNNNDKDLKLLFTPPSLKDVQQFCQQQKLKTDPVEFWTYYNIRKWAKIKNWQSQVMWWESRRFEKATDYNSTESIPSV